MAVGGGGDAYVFADVAAEVGEGGEVQLFGDFG